MRIKVKILLAIVLSFRYIPHILSYYLNKNIREDVRFWSKCYSVGYSGLVGMMYFLTYYKEFRNVMYKRLRVSLLHKILLPPLSSLYITTSRDKIGKALFIQHGFATIISAESIGEYCWINQQVTIGYTKKSVSPMIGNNVRIHAGALVLGQIRIGDNSVIAAGATVVDDVPPNSLVCSPKAKVVKVNDPHNTFS
ncbi:serine acetyltransferase [Bacteroides stercorirosoris]|uniref:Serine O-acetyltransferase n=1 Tax=Bacteroides stercorirosoris TaxID=871324 RepID=A0A1M6IDW9_9BACE|nr:serine acetyltransferase [Bacteroides stercorirosoris]SHJ32651.1 serine O-acetyltransferase [Bacteroides stercorirosoris]